MSDDNSNSIKIDFSGGMFILGIFLLIIFFWGEPDLHGALIHRLMSTPATVEAPMAELPQ